MALKAEKGIDLRNQKAINAADGTAATDLITKQQLDNSVLGLTWKNSVKAATTTNGALATAYANAQTIDGGISLVTGDRILIKDQTTQTENGIYIVTAGAPTRATDADSTAELQGAAVYVTQGTVNAEKAYTQTTDNVVIGTSNIVWAQFGGGTLPTAGAGLTLTGSVLDVGVGTGIVVNPNDVAIDPAIVVRKFSTGTHASTLSIAITHSLGTLLTNEGVYITATGERIYPDITHTSNNVTTFDFGTAPTANTLTFVIHG